jgi:hypothetical protein
MSALRVPVSAMLVALAAGPACAEAPAAALNKTITISFTASGMMSGPDGPSRPFNTAVARVIYVSGQGRLFMRHTATAGGGDMASGKGTRPSRQGEFAPGDSSPRGGSFSFQGNRLVGVISYSGGARQIIATFDGGFSSCTASVIEGNAGSGSFKRKGPNGVVHEITNATTSGVSCSIQSGNAFAQ